MVVGCVSGYFGILHVGHIDLFREAKKMCDKLVVIVNNDYQAKLKKTPQVVNEEQRLEIVRAIRYVDEAVLSIDLDHSVSLTLAQLKPSLFINGGDVIKEEDVREAKTCRRCGIKMVFLNLPKRNSSSWIIEKAVEIRAKNDKRKN